MFSITKSIRPDRCGLCKWANKESRYQKQFGNALPGYGYDHQNGVLMDVLVCKRMPPSTNENGNGVSPVVGDGNWCGEFEEK
jgi:hypothetical protein